MEYITDFFLTCWTKDISQEDMKVKLSFLECTNFSIGALEYTEEGFEHFHVLGKLKHSMRKELFIKVLNCPSTHVERTRNVANASEYITKEGCYYTTYEPIPNKDIYSAIVNDILYGFSFKEVCIKYPKFAFTHFSNLRDLYDTLVKSSN